MITKPIIRYYGGKWKLAPKIIALMPKHRVYVEPFGGAASVLMRKPISSVEVYNDLADDMVNLFQVLRCPVSSAKLRHLLSLTPYARAEWERALAPHDDPIEQARRTVILATFSHNPSRAMRREHNAFRVSTTGHHRLPHDFQNLVQNLELVTERLKGVIIERRDALDLMRRNDGLQTLFYVDPPYLASTRTNARYGYCYEALSDTSHERIARVLNDLKGFVLLSGYHSPLYTELYPGWVRMDFKATSGASKRGKSSRTECVWMNPKAAAAQAYQGRLDFNF